MTTPITEQINSLLEELSKIDPTIVEAEVLPPGVDAGVVATSSHSSGSSWASGSWAGSGTTADGKSLKPVEPWKSAGGVILPSDDPEDWDSVYIIKPTNNYGPWSFPKGKVGKGETKEQAAIREAGEETGLKCRILPNSYLGKGQGRFSVTEYFVMVVIGGSTANHDKEVEKVSLVSWPEAIHKFSKGSNKRDIKIAIRAMDWITRERRKRQGGSR